MSQISPLFLRKPRPSQDFVNYVYERFLDYDEATASFDEYVNDISDIYDNSRARFARNEDRQRELIIKYDKLLEKGRSCVLFIGFCMKNMDVLPGAISALRPQLIEAGFEGPQNFTRPALLREYAVDIRLRLFDGIRMLDAMYTPATRRNLETHLYRGDRFLAELLYGHPLRPHDFDNWVEFNFFRAFGVPLDKFSPTTQIYTRINNEMNTTQYRREFVKKVMSRKISVIFPGLSLDDIPGSRAEFEKISKQQGNDAFSESAQGHNVVRLITAPPAPRA